MVYYCTTFFNNKNIMQFELNEIDILATWF